MRLLFAIAASLALLSCSGSYDANGPCTADSDCEICEVCGCPQAYSLTDTNKVTCDKISSAASCSSDDGGNACLQGPRQAVCVSSGPNAGHCQAVSH